MWQKGSSLLAVLCTQANPSGKLDTPCVTSQVQEGQRPKVQPPLTTYISLVTPSGSYQVNGIANDSPTSFLLDTGPAVTLMRKDEWDIIPLGTKLEPWAEHNLVSVDNTPLFIYGLATVDHLLENRYIQWISLWWVL